MDLYKTVYDYGEAEQIIERSRFICSAMPVESKEEADEFIASIRKKYKDATHNVPAMVIGDKFQIQWASDDGEPQGTSGAPIVQMMVKEGITNTVLVVTRYFGGIKLGTGGLVRAYTSSAKLGLEAAGICSVKEQWSAKCVADYSSLARIQNAAEGNYVISGIEYTDKIAAEIVSDPENRDRIVEMITNICNGRCEFLDEKKELQKVVDTAL